MPLGLLARPLMSACLTLSLLTSMAQARMEHRGRVFLAWGYNRSAFTTSDIHLEGPGYSLTLKDVKATDRPHRFAFDTYFNPKYIWYPQYNYRIGWQFKEKWSISLGLDHMKYVMVQDQEVAWTGELSTKWERTATPTLVLDTNVLRYEHTDGLNLLSVDLDHYHTLWTGSAQRSDLRAYLGVHAGPVIARSDVRVFGDGLNNRFNVAGAGAGMQAGFHFTFLKHFFVRNMVRAGYITLPHVLTTGRAEDHAFQHFGFIQHAIVAGGAVRLGRDRTR